MEIGLLQSLPGNMKPTKNQVKLQFNYHKKPLMSLSGVFTRQYPPRLALYQKLPFKIHLPTAQNSIRSQSCSSVLFPPKRIMWNIINNRPGCQQYVESTYYSSQLKIIMNTKNSHVATPTVTRN